ncbi:MAG: hypothetical protein ACFFKA_07040 [Candidatus Thorarchaeota archaeon]
MLSEETEISILWNKTYGGHYVEVGQSIIKANSGGYVITGWTNSTGAGDLDIFLMRVDQNGTPMWNLTLGDVEEDKGYQIINCNLGGFALASTYTNMTAAVPNSDFLVTRIANDGSVLWNRSYSGPEQNSTHWIGDIGRSIVECSNGDFALAGATITDEGAYDIWLFRINSNGDKIWDRTYHNWYTERCYSPHSLVQCNDGGFALTGYTFNYSQSNDVWLLRTNSAGILLWNRTYGDPVGYERPEGLIKCFDGGFAIIANTHSFGAGGADAWVIRTNATGNQIWNKTYGGSSEDGGSYLIEMNDHGYTIAGSTHSFDVGNGDAWLIRTDLNGEIVWNHTIGDSYGNSAASFVYEGNNTYTVMGSTYTSGIGFQDTWIFKVQIKAVVIPSEELIPGFNIMSLFLVIIACYAIVTLNLLKKKKKIL